MKHLVTALLIVGLSPVFGSSEADKCRSILQRAFQAGRDARGIVGVHGTSVSAIKYVLQNGFLPTGTRRILRKKIYFYAAHHDRIGQQSLHPLRDEIEILAFDNAVSEATSYAAYSHRIKFLAEILKRDVAELYTNDELYNAIDGLLTNEAGRLIFNSEKPTGADLQYLQGESWFQYLKSTGLTFEQMKAIRVEALQQKGVLVFFDSKILSDFEVKNGETVEEPDEGTVILIPPNRAGLPVNYISGVEPLGNTEWTEIERMLFNP